MDLIEDIIDFILAVDIQTIDKNTINTVKQHVLDTIGVAIYGINDPFLHEVFSPIESDLEYPKIVKLAAASHVVEFDDIHDATVLCLGGLIITPLIMTLDAELTGRKFIEAILVGYHVAVKMALSFNSRQLLAEGWWPTVIFGPLGLAAAYSKIWGLSAEQTRSALSIAAMVSFGVLGAKDGLALRTMQFGLAAQNGYKAAKWARQGLKVSPTVFKEGIYKKQFISNERKLSKNDNFAILTTSIKPYACARQLHAAIQGIVRLMSSNGIVPNNISRVDIKLAKQAGFLINDDLPETREEAISNAAFTLALAIVKGDIKPEYFVTEFKNREVIAAAKIIRLMVHDETLNGNYFNWPGQVSLTLKDGFSLQTNITHAPGGPGNLLTNKEVERKFESLVQPIVGYKKAKKMKEQIANLEKLETLSALREILINLCETKKNKGGKTVG